VVTPAVWRKCRFYVCLSAYTHENSSANQFRVINLKFTQSSLFGTRFCAVYTNSGYATVVAYRVAGRARCGLCRAHRMMTMNVSAALGHPKISARIVPALGPINERREMTRQSDVRMRVTWQFSVVVVWTRLRFRRPLFARAHPPVGD